MLLKPLRRFRLHPPSLRVLIISLALLPALQCSQRDAPPSSLRDLPLVEIPTAADGNESRMAILLSGDGGWARIDKTLSLSLSKKGVPVVGLNCLRYLWKRRSQSEAAADLARIMRYYAAAWEKEKIILMGYSLGADILPAMVSALPREALDQVELIVLMGPADTYDWEFHLREWIPIRQSFALPVLPEAEKLRGKRILCIHGDQERESLCPDLKSLSEDLLLKGAHHFNGSYDTIVETILSESE